ncbi:HNH endonuclease [Enterobacteriaceae bacterium 8376wB9]|nr:HNH endonuclease [Enterobacteriaceae bacterium 8376wB9]
MITSIKFSKRSLDKISEKTELPDFCGSSWADEDIDFIRKEIKDYYIKEQSHTCVYCKQVFKSNNGRAWDIEHIISREAVHEFMFEPENLCVSCLDCNKRKGVGKVTKSKARKKMPSKANDYFIVHPHFDNYEHHIEAVKPGEFYFSKSAKGEFTISLCGLNRFYEFAGYDPAVAADDLILQYSDLLSKTQDHDKRKYLLRQISALALKELLVADEND